MRPSSLPVAACAVAGLALAMNPSLPMCDQPHFRMFRVADEANLVIRALDATAPASDALPPFVFAEWQPPGMRPTIAGQVVMVEHVLGENAAATRRALGSRSEAVLVPWDHDTGCEPIPWTLSPRWIAPGTVGFVAARLRPRAKWAGDYPTFDVRDAWREPYTTHRARSLAGGGPNAAGGDVMSAMEFGSFYLAFPELADWQRDPLRATRSLREWQVTHPLLAAKEPARVLMISMLRAAEAEAARR